MKMQFKPPAHDEGLGHMVWGSRLNATARLTTAIETSEELEWEDDSDVTSLHELVLKVGCHLQALHGFRMGLENEDTPAVTSLMRGVS